MNPDLALLATVQAGSIRVDGIHGPITGEVQAGNCKVQDFRGPLNLVVQAGNVTANGRLDSGSSKLRCEMGAVKIALEKGSSVRVTARSSLGKVSFDEHGDTVSIGGSKREVTIGAGAATLDIDCTMGTIKVSSE
jgi:hypothetical protein